MTLKQQLFIQSYLKTHNIKQSAQEIHTTESTVHKWLNDGLRQELEKIQKRIFSSAMHDLQDESKIISQSLVDIIKNPNTETKHKLKAIEIFFSVISDWKNSTEIFERLERLENMNQL